VFVYFSMAHSFTVGNARSVLYCASPALRNDVSAPKNIALILDSESKYVCRR
jgi:hypothetical protein